MGSTQPAARAIHPPDGLDEPVRGDAGRNAVCIPSSAFAGADWSHWERDLQNQRTCHVIVDQDYANSGRFALARRSTGTGRQTAAWLVRRLAQSAPMGVLSSALVVSKVLHLSQKILTAPALEENMHLGEMQCIID